LILFHIGSAISRLKSWAYTALFDSSLRKAFQCQKCRALITVGIVFYFSGEFVGVLMVS
jgi:hypothetical protein